MKPLPPGVLVDAEDMTRVLAAGPWHISDGYVANSQRIYLHRFLTGCVPGDDVFVDHFNHDPLDNRRTNLRPGTRRANQENRVGAAKHSKSGIRNVWWCAHNNGWRVQYTKDGVKRSVGTFASIEDAVAALEAARAAD